PRTHTATLFPYTTLFRSHSQSQDRLRIPGIQSAFANYGTGERGTSHLVRSDQQGGRRPKSARSARPGGTRRPCRSLPFPAFRRRSEEHTSELQSRGHIVC